MSSKNIPTSQQGHISTALQSNGETTFDICLMCLVIWERNRYFIEQVQRRATWVVPEKQTTADTKIAAPYLDLHKTGYRRNPYFHNCEINRHGKPWLQMFIVSITAHVPKIHWYQKGAWWHFLSTRVVKVWYSLSDNTVQARTTNDFKPRLRRVWRGHPDLYNYIFFKLISISYANRTKSILNKYINRETATSKNKLSDDRNAQSWATIDLTRYDIEVRITNSMC